MVVDLGGAAARAGRAALLNMAAQLVWTFTSPSYSPSFAPQSVVLEVNGVIQRLNGRGPQLLKSYAGLVPGLRAAPLYFLAGRPAARENSPPAGSISVLGQAGRSRLGPGTGGGPYQRLAVSPDGSQFAALAPDGRKKCLVSAGPLGRGGQVRTLPLSGACGSLSLDSSGDIWVTAGQALSVLTPGSGPADLTAALAPVQDPAVQIAAVSDIAVAPDGVRAAMILQPSGGPAQIVIGAISAASQVTGSRAGAPPSVRPQGEPPPTGIRGPDIGPTVPLSPGGADPVQLAWFNADSLLVLTGSPQRAALHLVPVDGGSPSRIPLVSQAVSMATNGTVLAVGTAGGRIELSAGLNGLWSPVTSGIAPAYPG